jgi:muconolactone delta-isomerase
MNLQMTYDLRKAEKALLRELERALRKTEARWREKEGQMKAPGRPAVNPTSRIHDQLKKFPSRKWLDCNG